MDGICRQFHGGLADLLVVLLVIEVQADGLGIALIYGVEVQVNFSLLLVVAVAHHGSQFAKGHRGARRIQVLAVVAQRPAQEFAPLRHRYRIGSGQRNVAAGQAVGFRQIIQVIVHKTDRHAGQRLFFRLGRILLEYGHKIYVGGRSGRSLHNRIQFTEGDAGAGRTNKARSLQLPVFESVAIRHRDLPGHRHADIAAGQGVRVHIVRAVRALEMDLERNIFRLGRRFIIDRIEVHVALAFRGNVIADLFFELLKRENRPFIAQVLALIVPALQILAVITVFQIIGQRQYIVRFHREPGSNLFVFTVQVLDNDFFQFRLRGFLGFRRFFRDLLHFNVHYTVCININFFVRVGQFIPHRHGNACLLKQIGHHDPIVSLYLNAGFCPIVKILATSAVSDMEHKIDHVRFFRRKRVQRQTADRHEDRDQHGQQAIQTTRLLHMITPFS